MRSAGTAAGVARHIARDQLAEIPEGTMRLVFYQLFRFIAVAKPPRDQGVTAVAFRVGIGS
jgi:hypothetical protein